MNEAQQLNAVLPFQFVDVPAAPSVVLHPVITESVTSARPMPETMDQDHAAGRLSSYFAVKTLVDRAITAALMVVALPLMVLIGLSILIASGRPIFYRQTRVGRHGRIFAIWKFRTMQPDAEATTGVTWSCPQDPRVTRLGRWLRCSHLDELPQFFNVLQGDMDLVGPRPERPEFVKQLIQQLPDYAQRLSVRPGITGLAQLKWGYDQTVADVRQKLKFDLEYIATTTFRRDLTILFATQPYILKQLWHKLRSPITAAVTPVVPPTTRGPTTPKISGRIVPRRAIRGSTLESLPSERRRA